MADFRNPKNTNANIIAKVKGFFTADNYGFGQLAAA